MKTSPAYLPQRKKQELKKIVDIILGVTDVEKIILFGSHATGKWVEEVYTEEHITYEYTSDFDILIVTKKNERREDFEIWDMVENRFNNREFFTPLNVIVHDIDYINKQLSEGQYFFSDIKKEGILLYDAERVTLARRKKLKSEDVKSIAQLDFDYWFESANDFLETFRFDFNRKKLNKAAFELHQATERYYHAISLIFTGYKYKTHNLSKLIKLTKRFSKELYGVFPRSNKENERLFELLQKAYVDARYKKDYKITKKELEYLSKRVKMLKALTKKICKKKIERFV